MLNKIIEDHKRFFVAASKCVVDLKFFYVLCDAALTNPFGDRGAFCFQLAVLVVFVQSSTAWVG